MSAPFVTDALVLGAVAYGEADRVVTLFSRDRGKLGAMARGARRSRNRFGAGLSLYVAGEAQLRERRGAELMTLESFHARRDFSALALDVVRLGHAAYATELLRELTVPHRADPPLFDLLVELYAVVEAHPPRAGTLRAFELRLLEELGLRPMLERCVVCGAEDAAALERAVVDAGKGGVVCARCGAGSRLSLLPGAARRRLLALRDAPSVDDAARLEPAGPDVEEAARAAMHALLEAHLSRPVRSVEFLKKLRGAARG
jgi:DNA repair protein RecO (recombination protein O)